MFLFKEVVAHFYCCFFKMKTMKVGNVLKAVFTTWTFFSCTGKDAQENVVHNENRERHSVVSIKSQQGQENEMNTVEMLQHQHANSF